MLTKFISSIDGKKTYLFVLAYCVYNLGINHGWWPRNTDLELFLLGGAGLSYRDAINKK